MPRFTAPLRLQWREPIQPFADLGWDRSEGALAVTHAALITALGLTLAELTSAQATPDVDIVHLRSHSERIKDAIAGGIARSATFRGLIAEIDGSDGLVYVEEGECRYNLNSCLLLSLTIAGSFRVLHVRVDRRVSGCALIEKIGHELQHVVEVLRERRIRSGPEIYHFFQGIGRTGISTFETEAAFDIGLAVDREACRGR